MRIAFTCHDSFPSPETNTQQIFWSLLEVARLGVAVDLIVPSSEPRSAVASYYGASIAQVPDGFRVVSVADGCAARSTLARGWFDLHLPRQIGRTYDLVWTRDLLAVLACVRAGLPTVFETYRPDVATSPALALWRRACLRHPRLKAVILHSRMADRAFAAARATPAPRLVAHNGFAPSLMEPRLDRAEARGRLGLPPDDRLAVYAGGVDGRKGIDALIGLAAALPDVRMLVVGADGQDAIKRAAGGAIPTNLAAVARVRLREVAAYLYAADCLVVPPSAQPLQRVKRTVLPIKLFMYLAAGRPILAPRLPDIEEVLTDGIDARLVPPIVEDAARALAGLLADDRLRATLAAGALAASTQYTWERRARRVVGFLEELQRRADGEGGTIRSAPYAQALNS